MLLPHAECLHGKASEFGEFLGLICAEWSYLAARSSLLQSICKSKRQLCVQQPHATQILGILCLAAVGHTELANHLIQINTGEGKSIALGFTAAVFAKLGYKVDVVCYNSYLSKRDSDAFSDLFSSLCLQNVNYSDFDELCSRLMETDECLPNVRRIFKCFLTNSKNRISRSNGKEKSLLLLDEVDVFFSEDFYGRPHCPAVSIDDGEGYLILKRVWENRDSVGNREAFVSDLMALPETCSLKRKYPNLPDEMLRQEFRKMYACVLQFPKGRQPQLTGGARQYVVDRHKQRIGYENPVSGVPSFTASYSYLTAFTYFQCCEDGQLSEDAVRQNIQMQPVCGSILYSCIPRLYNVCLGMTGTLDCLTDAQRQLLNEYNFYRSTFLPSTFAKKVMNVTQSADLSATRVIRGSKEEYFLALIEELNRELHLGRAILIVFADYLKLSWFQNEIKKRSPKHPQYRLPLELTDRLSPSERQNVIDRAIRSYAITLMTRSYGRGTDFVCRDEGLRKNGGVHVVVTFFPEHESEHKQIFGRTCRQDDPGSGRKILFEEDLAPLGATEREFMASGIVSWDEYLTMKRAECERITYEKMRQASIIQNKNHEKTIEACDLAECGRWGEARDHFLTLNANQLVTNQRDCNYHVVFVLDESGSMKG